MMHNQSASKSKHNNGFWKCPNVLQHLPKRFSRIGHKEQKISMEVYSSIQKPHITIYIGDHFHCLLCVCYVGVCLLYCVVFVILCCVCYIVLCLLYCGLIV